MWVANGRTSLPSTMSNLSGEPASPRAETGVGERMGGKVPAAALTFAESP